jgi:hypothetical protein
LAAATELLLTNDYGAPSPVWLSSTTVLSDLSTLGLRQHLIDSLLAWQLHFDEHFTPGGGWSSAETAIAYANQGHELHDRLSRALPHHSHARPLARGPAPRRPKPATPQTEHRPPRTQTRPPMNYVTARVGTVGGEKPTPSP